MSLLEHINEPADLAGLTYPEMQELAEEIRQFLIHSVSQTGGHLGPNLGVVELTLAITCIRSSLVGENASIPYDRQVDYLVIPVAQKVVMTGLNLLTLQLRCPMQMVL